MLQLQYLLHLNLEEKGLYLKNIVYEETSNFLSLYPPSPFCCDSPSSYLIEP